MKEALKLTSPFSEAAARSLKAGDRVLFTGVIWTGRDAAHKRLVALLDEGKPLPVELRDQLIDQIIRVCNGEPTCAEALGYTETALPHLCNYM